MIEVLPAPFGPMIENSSPSLTAKLTSLSARTPPKRSETLSASNACATRSRRAAIPDRHCALFFAGGHVAGAMVVLGGPRPAAAMGMLWMDVTAHPRYTIVSASGGRRNTAPYHGRA